MVLFDYPPVEDCELYKVNKDILFSYKKTSELFLNSLISLFVSSHYKNSPDDLQLLSDAPGHSVFILTQDLKKQAQQESGSSNGIPEILVAIQVTEEGGIKKEVIIDTQDKGNNPPGDLIPWTLSNYFQDSDFPEAKRSKNSKNSMSS